MRARRRSRATRKQSMHYPVIADRNSSRTALQHRTDIDGLRGIAVLSVVACHAFPSTLRSGFVGVDIFFVISGFLITSIILNDIANDRFSFREFYARRIKRIFPALAVVLAACLVAGALLLLPEDFRLLGKHAVAAVGFLSNFALWQEANYFDVAAESKILLHLWSLGIEEQYYLLWPLLIWTASRLRLNLFTLFLAIFAASLALCVKWTPLNQVAAFYSPASRFWELAAGSILAQLTLSTPRAAVFIETTIANVISSVVFDRGAVDKEKIYRDFLSLAAFGLITSSVFVITRRHEFPGWWALLPVFGAYLAINAGPQAMLNRLLLTNRILVWIGLVSYPLYLWHWPLLVFARDLYGSASRRFMSAVWGRAGTVMDDLSICRISDPLQKPSYLDNQGARGGDVIDRVCRRYRFPNGGTSAISTPTVLCRPWRPGRRSTPVLYPTF